MSIDYVRVVAERDPIVMHGGCCDSSYSCFWCGGDDSDVHKDDCAWLCARLALGLHVERDRHHNEHGEFGDKDYAQRKEREGDVAQYGPIGPMHGPLDAMQTLFADVSRQLYTQKTPVLGSKGVAWDLLIGGEYK